MENNQSKLQLIDTTPSNYIDSIKKDVDLLSEHPDITAADASLARYMNVAIDTPMTYDANSIIEHHIFRVMERFLTSHSDYSYGHLGTSEGAPARNQYRESYRLGIGEPQNYR